MKRLLNYSEAVTHKRLNEACCRNGAKVFAKIRLADVLPIENSGISTPLYSFALKSHFDFVIATEQHDPLFAVEFDGPSHGEPTQVDRDDKKNALCDRFSCPLLRVNANYLEQKYRNLDLLTWFVEVWFASDAFYLAQRNGLVPDEEDFDVGSMIRVGGLSTEFPLWLGAKPLVHLRQCYDEGKCQWQVPARMVGINGNGDTIGLGYLRVTDNGWLISRTGMQYQRFPTRVSELVGDLLAYEIAEAVSRGDLRGLVSEEIVNKASREFEAKYELRSFSSGR